MRVEINDRGALSSVSPGDLTAYLSVAGWLEGESKPGRYSVWTRGNEFEILVPLSRELGDFALRVRDVVKTLEAAEDRSQFSILTDLVTSSSDLIRAGLKEPDLSSGTVPLEDGVALVEKARDLLLAAASAAIDPRSTYGPKKHTKANDFLRKARLGQTEWGSYVVTIVSRVPPDFQQAAESPMLGEPFERHVIETLARSLSATQAAAERAAVNRNFDEFKRGVKDGISSNLCEAIVGMAGGTQSNRGVSFEFSWARNRRRVPNVPAVVRIASDDIPVIAEAARVFRETAPLEDYRLFGPVVKLERPPGSSGVGTVTVLSLVADSPRGVRMELPTDEYSIALAAHDMQLPLSGAGVLTREGRGFVLTNPKDLTIVMDESEDQPPQGFRRRDSSESEN